MFDLHNLVPFVQVVKSGSFSAAAAQLGVTPPAVSKSIARLEKSLGVRLLFRTTRQLQLTSEGRDFFQRVGPLLDSLHGAVDGVKNATPEPRGLVRVAVSATFGRFCLLPVLAEFFQLHPEVELELDFDDTPPDLLEQGFFDVEIRLGQGSQTSYVSRRLLFDYPVIMVASPDYLKVRGVPRSIEDLDRHECIGANTSSGITAEWKLTHIEAPAASPSRKKKAPSFLPIPRGRLTVGVQYDTSLIAALHGIGIAFAPLPGALPHLAAGQLKTVLPDYQIMNTSPSGNQVYIRYPHRQYLPPKVRVFVEYLLAKFSEREDPRALIRAYAA